MEEDRRGGGNADTEEKAWGKPKTNTRKRKHSGKKLEKRNYMGNCHCQFCSLQEAAAPISLLAVMEQKGSLWDLTPGAVMMLTAAQEKVPFKWQKWWEVPCHGLLSQGLAHSWQVFCQCWTSSLINVAWRCGSEGCTQRSCPTQMWQGAWRVDFTS